MRGKGAVRVNLIHHQQTNNCSPLALAMLPSQT
jgi:hypothetical protein